MPATTAKQICAWWPELFPRSRKPSPRKEMRGLQALSPSPDPISQLHICFLWGSENPTIHTWGWVQGCSAWWCVCSRHASSFLWMSGACLSFSFSLGCGLRSIISSSIFPELCTLCKCVFCKRNQFAGAIKLAAFCNLLFPRWCVKGMGEAGFFSGKHCFLHFFLHGVSGRVTQSCPQHLLEISSKSFLSSPENFLKIHTESVGILQKAQVLESHSYQLEGGEGIKLPGFSHECLGLLVWQIMDSNRATAQATASSQCTCRRRKHYRPLHTAHLHASILQRFPEQCDQVLPGSL